MNNDVIESIQSYMPRIMDMFMNPNRAARAGEEAGGDGHVNIHINVNPVEAPNRIDGRLNVIRRLLGYITTSLNELDRIPNPENSSNVLRTTFTAGMPNNNATATSNPNSISNLNANPTQSSNGNPTLTANSNTSSTPTSGSIPQVNVNANSLGNELRSSLISPLVNSLLSSTMNMLGMPMGFRINELQFQSPNEVTGTATFTRSSSASASSSRPTPSAPSTNDSAAASATSTASTNNETSNATQNGTQRNSFEVLRELMEETSRAQQRIDRHLSRMSEGLREDTELSQEQLTTLQRDHRFISRVTHHISHVYHLLSDLRINFAQRERHEITLFAQDSQHTGRSLRRTVNPIRTMSETRRPHSSQRNSTTTSRSTSQAPPTTTSSSSQPANTGSGSMSMSNLGTGISGPMIFSSTPIVVMASTHRMGPNQSQSVNASSGSNSSGASTPNHTASNHQSTPTSQPPTNVPPPPEVNTNSSAQTNPNNANRSSSGPFSFVSFEAAHPSNTSMGHFLDPYMRCNSHWVYPEMREVLDIGLMAMPTGVSARTSAPQSNSANSNGTQPTSSTATTFRTSLDPGPTSSSSFSSSNTGSRLPHSTSMNHIYNLYLIVAQHLTESEIVRAFTELNFAVFARVYDELHSYVCTRMFNRPDVETSQLNSVTESLIRPIQLCIEQVFVSLNFYFNFLF